MQKKFLYVVNPIAGGAAHQHDTLDHIRHVLDNPMIELFQTTGGDDQPRIRELAQQHHWSGIMVGGGDGTINAVVQAVSGLSVPLGIIPFGSANGLATCLDIFDIDDTLEAIGKGQIQPLDVLRINGQLCIHLADFGFNAGLVKKFDEGSQRGMLAYFRNSLQEFMENKPYQFVVGLEGQQVRVEAKMLVIANGDKYGTRAIINPDSAMDDGQLEIIALNPRGLDEVVSLSIDLYRGTLADSPLVKRWSCRQAWIENPDGALFQIDGEVMGHTPRAEVVCEPHQVSFFVPQPAGGHSSGG